MSSTKSCRDCGHAFPISEDRCPHCARPALFPNVELAEADKERRALTRRYDWAVEDAARRGCADKVRDFESRAGRSKAVIARDLGETLKLAAGANSVYGTYYQLTDCGLRIPDGSKWDSLRSIADDALFGSYKKEIRFAALSLDSLGLVAYGDCFWVLRDEMIAHRASVFEENSVTFLARQGIRIQLTQAPKLPAGYRATWAERSKLCVAKLGGKIGEGTKANDFPKLLLRQGSTPEEDEFVEVHVGGSVTVRTLEQVILKLGTWRSTTGKALRAKLEKYGVEVRSKKWTR